MLQSHQSRCVHWKTRQLATFCDPVGCLTHLNWVSCSPLRNGDISWFFCWFGRYALYLRPSREKYALANVDKFGDSYTTPLSAQGLRNVSQPENLSNEKIMAGMNDHGNERPQDPEPILDEFQGDLIGCLFAGCVVYMDSRHGWS